MNEQPNTQGAEAAFARSLARRLPFFYGWVIVFVSFLCSFIMGATTFWALPVFVGPMHDDTGWSHTVIFLGLSLNFLATGFGGLIFGRFTDRRGGASRLLLVGVLVVGVALISLRWVTSPLQFVVIYGLVAGFGGTSIRLVQATLISKWFVAKRGSAVGMASNGGSIAALVMVPLIAQLIDSYGWRDAWSILGVVALVIMLPLVPLVVRSPEDFGLEPDNGYQSPPGRRNASVERSYHLRDVVRSGSFWFLMLGILVGNYSLQAHTVIIIPRLEEIGYSSEAAATALSMYGLFSLAMRFVWGNLADTRGVRLAIVAQSALSAVGALLLFQVAGPWTLYAIIAFQGLVMSGYPPLQIMVWPEFFGRDYIGSIVGVTQPFVTMSGATAPVIVGALHDVTGSYAVPIWMLAGTWLLCSMVMVMVRPGVKSETTAAVPAG